MIKRKGKKLVFEENINLVTLKKVNSYFQASKQIKMHSLFSLDLINKGVNNYLEVIVKINK